MRRWFPIILLALSIAYPILVNSIDPFLVVFGTNILIYTILALGLQAIFGSAGMVELCHASFFGIGAYTSGLLSVRFGLPFFVTGLCGIVAAVLGGLIMVPIVRLRESYYAMSTFAFGSIVMVLLRELSFTGGVNGLGGISPASLGRLSFEKPIWFFYLVLALVIAVYLLFQRIGTNYFGMCLHAVRQNEASSQAVGISPNAVRSFVTLLAAGSAGLAGVLIAHSQGFISPDMFSTDKSLFLVGIVVVGGLRYPEGAWMGAIVMMIVAEYSRELKEYIALVYGLVLALSMIFFPKGLWGYLRSLITQKQSQKFL